MERKQRRCVYAESDRRSGRSEIPARQPLVVRYATCIGCGVGGDGGCQRLHGHAAGGCMSKRNELNSYIARLQQRLRLGAWLRGAAIFTGTALIVTVALVLLLNHYAFPAHGVTGARLALLAVLAAVAGFGIALPLVRLTRARAVREAEGAHSELEQRLTTFHERERDGGDPFLELLASDPFWRTQDAAPSSLVPDNRLFALS